MTASPRIRTTLASLPKKPGVYIFKDEARHVLYVGKAKFLAHRVRSYFQKSRDLEPGKESMVGQIADIETIVAPSEADALLLEATLIKEHQPPYNIILKDDKYFLYIRITMSEEFPTVDLVRSVTKKSDLYFGPYTSAYAVRETLKTLKRIFKFRTCTPHQGKPCFDYTIGRCLGPCIDAIAPQEYRQMISDLVKFLKGQDEIVLHELDVRMRKASAQKQFEYAATIRDRMNAIQRIARKQIVIAQKPFAFDVLGVAKEKRTAAVAILQIRGGKLVNKQSFILSNKPNENEREILDAFMAQYYSQTPDHPRDIFSELEPINARLFEKAFNMRVERPTRGSKAELARTAHDNAEQALQSHFASFEKDEQKTESTLAGIAKAFSLNHPPVRIECFDVANIQGLHAVGSMVVFLGGKPERKLYKRFTIKTVDAANDPAMMAEIVSRRLVHLASGDSGWERPDLLLIDGGKGQLAGIRGNGILNREKIPVFAFAKGGHAKPTEQSGREHFFDLAGKEYKLPATSQELYLLERIRDEAHRFAITHYQGKHEKATVASELDRIRGIGPKRKRDLLRHFGSLEGIKKARREDLERLLGKKMAEGIQRELAS